MKAKVLDISGNVLREVELPAVFSEEFRPDLIKKAVLSLQSRRFQPKGASKLAGKDTSAESWGPGHGVSRVPRIKTGRRAARVPQAVGGRRAHPPKAEKEILKKINKKERWKALRSAIAATADPSLVKARGHKFSEEVSLPIVVENALVTLSKTADVEAFLKAVGIWEDVLRAKRKKVRAGRGKMRGRRYRRKKSVLFVISGDEMPTAEGKEEKEERKEERGREERSERGGGLLPLERSARNLPGVDVCRVAALNVELLAPGTHPGRLTVWTEDAISKLASLPFASATASVEANAYSEEQEATETRVEE